MLFEQVWDSLLHQKTFWDKMTPSEFFEHIWIDKLSSHRFSALHHIVVSFLTQYMAHQRYVQGYAKTSPRFLRINPHLSPGRLADSIWAVFVEAGGLRKSNPISMLTALHISALSPHCEHNWSG